MKLRALAPVLLMLTAANFVVAAGAVQRVVMIEEFGFQT
jgi:hypothetical protein